MTAIAGVVLGVWCSCGMATFFFFSSRRRHTRCLSDWSSDVCSSDLEHGYSGCIGVLAIGCQVASRSVPELPSRSEERRVGKECRSGWSAYHEEKRKERTRGRRKEGRAQEQRMVGRTRLRGADSRHEY